MTWQKQLLPNDHPQVASGSIGVLLINLGTPEAPTAGAVKTYLKQFLSDRRVIEIPALLWQPLLRGVILNTRPKKSAEAYSKVWTENGSPLADITARQAEAMAAKVGENVVVEYAMRYGSPSIEEQLTKLTEAGCDRILIAPLYPQYCAATTATVFDEVARIMGEMRWQPALRFLPPYHDNPAYLDALASDLTRQVDVLSFKPEVLLLS